MKNASTLFFDLDGTLTDSREGITKTLSHALRTVGYEPPPLQALERYIGPPLHQTFSQLLPHDKVDPALAAYRYRYNEQGYGISENKLYDGIHEVLHQLCALGKKLYVVTAKAQPISGRIVDHFDLSRYMVKVFGPEPGQKIADKTGLVAAALAHAQTRPDDTIMIGDRHHDVDAALHNGVRCIGAGWGFGSADELLTAGAVTVAARPLDLLGLLA